MLSVVSLEDYRYITPKNTEKKNRVGKKGEINVLRVFKSVSLSTRLPKWFTASTHSTSIV